jgi:hypothetical protein
MQRLDFISNRVFSKKFKKRFKSFESKNFNFNASFFNRQSFKKVSGIATPNYLIKKSVKKNKFLKFSSLNMLSNKKEQKKKFLHLPIENRVPNKSIFYFNSTFDIARLVLKNKFLSNKQSYFTKQKGSSMLFQTFGVATQTKKNFSNNDSSFIIKRPLLNLSIQKITFKKLGYIFSIKRNLKLKNSFKKADKIFSFFPFMQKEIFSMNNFCLNDPGKNSQSLSLGNPLQWSPFPKIGFRWFPFESYTNTSGVFICGSDIQPYKKDSATNLLVAKPFLFEGRFSSLPQNYLNQTKEVLNEKIKEFKNFYFFENKRCIFI